MAQGNRGQLVTGPVGPTLVRLVREITGDDICAHATPLRIREWRHAAQAAAIRQAGFTYVGYARLKVDAVLRTLSDSIAQVLDIGDDAAARTAIRAKLIAWAEHG